MLQFVGIPNFAPEILRRVVLEDAMRAKQLNKALNDLAEEGVVQIFRPVDGAWPILGAVGALQLDVLQSRLKAEYGVSIRLEAAPYETARWIGSEKPDAVQRFRDANRSSIAEDRNSNLVFLARNAWALEARHRGMAGHQVPERAGTLAAPPPTADTRRGALPSPLSQAEIRVRLTSTAITDGSTIL